MIRSGRASFVVRSTRTSPAVVSDILGMEPTETIHKGTRTQSGRVQQFNLWSFDSELIENTSHDETGTLSLKWLLDKCETANGRVTMLPDDCEVRLWWSAYSDSTQGGFVLPPALAGQIAALGVDTYVSVYADVEEAPLAGPAAGECASRASTHPDKA